MATLVAIFYVVGWLLPRLGGPRVLEGVHVTPPLVSLLSWTGLTFAVAGGVFVLERATALRQAVRSPGFRLLPLRQAFVRYTTRRSHRFLTILGGSLLVQLFMPAFVGYKTAIPELQAWGWWDKLFILWDRVLHGGRHPWEALQPLLGHPPATVLLDRLYYAWFPAAVIGFLLLTFWAVGSARIQVLVSYAATWLILGILLATATASVGPCYVAHLQGIEDPYRELMEYLTAVHSGTSLQALEIQRILWSSYQTESRTLVSGIAAMPSLHVAIPALFAVASWRRSRLLSGGFWVFTFLILVGSVHLGWHYAIDGYVSIVLVVPIWMASGIVARWWVARTRRWRWGWRNPGSRAS